MSSKYRNQKRNAMKYTINMMLALTMILFLSSFSSSPAEAPSALRWAKLGSSKVDFKLDKDVILLGPREGRFSKLKLDVSGGNLNMHRMKIEYLNGQSEIYDLAHKFTNRASTHIIDIDGRRRVIKKITFWHNTKKRCRNKAKITVFGK